MPTASLTAAFLRSGSRIGIGRSRIVALLTSGTSSNHKDYYGGGASQAVQLYGPGVHHASVYQIGLQLAKGRRYIFYVFLKRRKTGKAYVVLDKLRGPVYERRQLGEMSDRWQRYTAELTAPEDTNKARIRIAIEGQGTFWMDSASLMPADNLDGMRRDVIDAMRPMRIPLMRYLGGCFADYYHWQNGIRNRDKRPEVYSRLAGMGSQ